MNLELNHMTDEFGDAVVLTDAEVSAVAVIVADDSDVADWTVLDEGGDMHNCVRRFFVVPSGSVPPGQVVTRIARAAGVPVRALTAVRRIPRDTTGAVDTDAITPLLDVTPTESTVAVTYEQRTRRTRDRDAPPAHRRTIDDAIPAEVHGLPLRYLPDDPTTVTEAVLSASTRFPDAGVTIVGPNGDRRFNYATLVDSGLHLLAGLHGHGVTAGDDVILALSDIADYVRGVWACLLGGIRFTTIPAPTGAERDTNRNRIEQATAILGPVLIVTNTGMAPSLADDPDLGPAVAYDDLAAPDPATPVHTSPENIAALVQSSGSTGIPKLIAITHRAVVENALSAREVDLVRSGETSFNFLPFDHVPPLVMYLLRDVVVGCESVHAPTDFIVADPLRWLDTLERLGVHHTWCANFGYRLVPDALAAANTDRNWDLTSVRTMLNAGEQCTAPVVDAFVAATEPFGIRSEVMVHMWGMAETATGASYKFYVESGARRTTSGVANWSGAPTDLLSMGHPTPGSSLRVVDDRGVTCLERTIGNLQAGGARITPGYVGDPERTATVMTDDGWFDTGDLAFVIDGEIVITGRTKDVLVINGDKYFCHTLEEVAYTVPGVRPAFAAACGVPDAASGSETPVIFFVRRGDEMGASEDLAAAIRDAIFSRLRIAATVVEIDESAFPFTSGGKIRRSELVSRSAAGDFGELVHSTLDVADCVFTPAWTAMPRRPVVRRSRSTVVFVDGLGLAPHVVDETDIQVHVSETFRVDANRFWVRPHQHGDIAALAAALIERGVHVERVLYLWSYEAAPPVAPDDHHAMEGLSRCGSVLINVIRSLAVTGAQVVTVSRALRAVAGDEDPCCYPAASAAALVATHRREHPTARSVHIDLPGTDLESDAAALRDVLTDASVVAHAEIVWRKGLPHVRSLDGPLPHVDQVDPLTRGGRYVVVGGGGGVGMHMCGDLARRYDLRLTVVSRSVIDGDMPQGDLDIVHRRGDVCSVDDLRAVLDASEKHWGAEIDGVLHLADSYRMRSLSDENPADWVVTEDAKSYGLLTLSEVLADRPRAQVVVFTSSLGAYPAAGCGRYAASNALAHAIVDRMGSRARTIAWSLIDGVGVNRDNPHADLAARRGFLSLSPAEAAVQMRIALRMAQRHTYVGTDPAGTNVRASVRGSDRLQLLASRSDLPSETLIAEAAPLDESTRAIFEVVAQVFSSLAGKPVTPRSRLHELGLDSVRVVRAHAQLEARLELGIDTEILFTAEDLGSLAAALS